MDLLQRRVVPSNDKLVPTPLIPGIAILYSHELVNWSKIVDYPHSKFFTFCKDRFLSVLFVSVAQELSGNCFEAACAT